ncbi:transmembrane protein, putative (macronuclear) [Tetrahymena thermophila SB210]|uniref:Transmembrane protein, putative n=1 Tax=Tetrahymena thermophila (strain SB210) TaxID=312017 RepID=W7X409_TETTS|nr:transmembrane protein, putative [Tetrahymena thermophila SB210]EWS74050.1 transmembrane protein, putative [Tetrahymena thermophila SB210]|eukprot:XP_012653383.1 transmembrane protein, putative [Tetrahymena thermophila SB210]
MTIFQQQLLLTPGVNWKHSSFLIFSCSLQSSTKNLLIKFLLQLFTTVLLLLLFSFSYQLSEQDQWSESLSSNKAISERIPVDQNYSIFFLLIQYLLMFSKIMGFTIRVMFCLIWIKLWSQSLFISCLLILFRGSLNCNSKQGGKFSKFFMMKLQILFNWMFQLSLNLRIYLLN